MTRSDVLCQGMLESLMDSFGRKGAFQEENELATFRSNDCCLAGEALGRIAMRHTCVIVTCCIAVLACGMAARGAETEGAAAGKPFGKSPEGQAIQLFTLKNHKGMETGIMTWGATLVSLKVADVEGRFDDVVLGFDDASGYSDRNPFFGALTGRYANRIARGRFAVHGREYKLSVNDGENTLHGGSRGFDKRVWTVLRAGPDLLELRYVSPDGEEGFPGELTATVRYTLAVDNELRIDCAVTTDKDTVQNLGSHPYFNLAGESNGTILDQELEINADRFTPVDPHRIPTGEIRSVEGTPMDFRKPMRIGARIDADDEQLKNGGGYDENFVLNRTGDGLIWAARLRDPHSGRVMELLTTEPGLQMYSGNFLDGKLKSKGGRTYPRYGGLVLEAQHFPDSPNHPNFPSTELKAGQTYHSTTVYRFSVAR